MRDRLCALLILDRSIKRVATKESWRRFHRMRNDRETQREFLTALPTIRWSKPQRYRGAYLFRGEFVSPGAEFVPEASRVCSFQMIFPDNSTKTSSSSSPATPTTSRELKSNEDIEAFIRDHPQIPCVTLLPPTVESPFVCVFRHSMLRFVCST